MKIKMLLLSDTIFGNGASIPGAEDISVLCDDFGFPYYKGGTFKGIFRETLEVYLGLLGKNDSEVLEIIERLLGKPGATGNSDNNLVFSDFTLSEHVKKKVILEVGKNNPDLIKQIFTNLRAFTAIDEGRVQDGSLRYARCVNNGLCFYSEVICCKEDEELVREILAMIKNIGTMRNRGFGNVIISEEV